MSRTTETRSVHLNVSPTQMEMRTSTSKSAIPIAEDFGGQLIAAQEQLEKLQQQQELIAKQKKELEELNERKNEFLLGQNDITERLNSSLTAIDRELFEMRQEMNDLEQTRKCFADHQQKIDAINPQGWTRDELKIQLDRAIGMLDHAEDEYLEAMEHFQKSQRSVVFSPANNKKKSTMLSGSHTEFSNHFKQGLAFNLPLIIAAIICTLIFFLK